MGTRKSPSDSTQPVLNIELIDHKAQATEFSLNYEQNPVNSRMANMMKQAFPMTSEKTGRLFLKIKSTDAEKLDESFEEFLASLVDLIKEHKMAEDEGLGKLIDSIRVQIGHAGSNCILMLPFDSNEVFQSIEETVEKSLGMLNNTGLKFTSSIGLGITLKDLVDYVKSIQKR
jgi:hypothetical protein